MGRAGEPPWGVTMGRAGRATMGRTGESPWGGLGRATMGRAGGSSGVVRGCRGGICPLAPGLGGRHINNQFSQNVLFCKTRAHVRSAVKECECKGLAELDFFFLGGALNFALPPGARPPHYATGGGRGAIMAATTV